jgi:hypothetical protein
MTEEARDEVERMLRLNERQQALDYLKTSFRISDAEAILLVETLEREMEIKPAATPPSDNDTLQGEVAELLRAGRQTEALNRVRQQKNLSLREALIYIAEAVRQHHPSSVGSTYPGGCLRSVAKGVAIVIMIGSLLFIAGAVIIYFIQENAIGNSDRIEAVVTQMKALESGETAPVVEFEWNGKKRSYESTFYSSPPDHQEGEHMFVFVNRENPEKVVLDTFGDRWALIVGLAVPGASFLMISIVILYFTRRKF